MRGHGSVPPEARFEQGKCTQLGGRPSARDKKTVAMATVVRTKPIPLGQRNGTFERTKRSGYD